MASEAEGEAGDFEVQTSEQLSADSQHDPQHDPQALPSEGTDAQPINGSGAAEAQGKPKRERKDPEPCDPPDHAEYNKKQEEQKAIEAQLESKAKKLTQEIDKAVAKRDADRKLLEEARAGLQKIQSEKKGIDVSTARAEYNKEAASRKEQREYLDEIKTGLKFASTAEVEQAIQKIELRLASATLVPAARTQCEQDVAMLKNQRLATREYEEKLALIKVDVSAKKDPTKLQEVIGAGVRQIGELRKIEDEKRKDFLKYKTIVDDQNKIINDLIAKRKPILDERSQVRGVMRKLENEFRNQEYRYKRWVDFSEYLKRKAAREERARKVEERKRAEESGEAEAEGTPENWSGDGSVKGKAGEGSSRGGSKRGNKAAAAGGAAAGSAAAGGAAAPAQESKVKTVQVVKTPYDAELRILTDLKRYLEFYKPRDALREEKEVAAPVQRVQREFNDKKKVTEFKRKNEIEDEWGSVIGTKKQGKAPRQEQKPKKVKDTPVNHMPEALAKFKKVEVEPPLKTSQVMDVLKLLEDKRIYYENKGKQELEAAEKGLPPVEEAPATPSPAEDKPAEEELEEGEIVEEEGQEEEELSPEQAAAMASMNDVLGEITEEAAEGLRATTQTVEKEVTQAIEKALETTQKKAEEEEEELTPEQQQAMAEMNDVLGGITEEALQGLKEALPEVKKMIPTQHAETGEKQAEAKKRKESEKQTETKEGQAEEEEEEVSPEQAAAMAAMNEELGDITETAIQALQQTTQSVQKEVTHAIEEALEKQKAEAQKEAEEEELSEEQANAMSAMNDVLGGITEEALRDLKQSAAEVAEEEELTPEQAAAMAAMNDVLGDITEEAIQGLKSSEKKEEKHVTPAQAADSIEAAIVHIAEEKKADKAEAKEEGEVEEEEQGEGDEEEEAGEGDEEEVVEEVVEEVEEGEAEDGEAEEEEAEGDEEAAAEEEEPADAE